MKNMGYGGPVIALTGNDDTTDFELAGADGMLTKPVNWARLAAAMSEAIATCAAAAAAADAAADDENNCDDGGRPAELTGAASAGAAPSGTSTKSAAAPARELLQRVASCTSGKTVGGRAPQRRSKTKVHKSARTQRTHGCPPTCLPAHSPINQDLLPLQALSRPSLGPP